MKYRSVIREKEKRGPNETECLCSIFFIYATVQTKGNFQLPHLTEDQVKVKVC